MHSLLFLSFFLILISTARVCVCLTVQWDFFWFHFTNVHAQIDGIVPIICGVVCAFNFNGAPSSLSQLIVLFLVLFSILLLSLVTDKIPNIHTHNHHNDHWQSVVATKKKGRKSTERSNCKATKTNWVISFLVWTLGCCRAHAHKCLVCFFSLVCHYHSMCVCLFALNWKNGNRKFIANNDTKTCTRRRRCWWLTTTWHWPKCFFRFRSASHIPINTFSFSHFLRYFLLAVYKYQSFVVYLTFWWIHRHLNMRWQNHSARTHTVKQLKWQ